MGSRKGVVLISILLISVVIIGEVAVYGLGSDRYSSSASFDGGTLSYSITVSGSKEYSLVVSDGENGPMDELYIYYDATYPTTSNADHDRIKDITNALRYAGVTNVTKVNAEELQEKISNDITAGLHSKGLLMLSGAFPDTIYTGDLEEDDGGILFSWMNEGGRIYWAGDLIGKYVATENGIVDADADYQNLFFGTACLNEGPASTAYSEETGNQYKGALSLMNSNVRYGVNASFISGRDVLPVGYTEDGYSSITLVEYGAGMICVFGGGYSTNQRKDITQTIASNISPSSNLVLNVEGVVKRTTFRSDLDITASGNLSVYIYIGGDFIVYGKLYSFTP